MKRTMGLIVVLGLSGLFACSHKNDAKTEGKKTDQTEPGESAADTTDSKELGSQSIYDSATPLKGSIDGVDYTFGRGYAHPVYQDELSRVGTYSISLSPSNHPMSNSFRCGDNATDSAPENQESAGEYRSISFYLPPDLNVVEVRKEEATKYPGIVNPPDAVFFDYGNWSFRAHEGRIVIVERTATRIRGYLEASESPRAGLKRKSSQVQGRFEAVICR